MEITSKFRDREIQSPLNSPRSNGSSGAPIQTPTHLPITRSDPNNPYPTTFVTADTSSFKQVVQLLTGSSETSKNHDHPLPPPPSSSKNFVIPPIRTSPKKQGGFKLYERRNILKMISPLNANFSAASSSFSPRNLPPEMLSPSLLDFPSLTLSPVTPLTDDPFDKSSSEEERAIAEKGFYLHPSPISTPRDAEPQLLPLFPVSSPRASES